MLSRFVLYALLFFNFIEEMLHIHIVLASDRLRW